MNAKDVIRAWKDSEYRNSLSPEQRAMLPENPAGALELKDVDLDAVAAGITVGLMCGLSWLSCP